MLFQVIGGFIFGTLIGSFLNVVVLRFHAGKDFKKGRSKCPQCGHELSWFELIPIFSWLALRGRCRRCHKAISVQYPAVELLTGVVFALFLAANPIYAPIDILLTALWFYILGALIVLSVYDLRWYLLPDKILLPIIIPATAIILISTVNHQSWQVLSGPLLAALGLGGAFYAVAAVSEGRWMGGGDIKLAFVIGLLLGVQKGLVAMFIAFTLAAVVGSLLIAFKKSKFGSHIPFGPFLIFGTYAALIFGAQIINWYLGISGLKYL